MIPVTVFMPDTTIQRLLNEIQQGHKEAMNDLLPLVYEELRRMARAYFRRERGDHTMQPTALVHEAYMRMTDQRVPMENRSHFLAVAATQMRRVLLDYARRHERRGGSDRVVLEDSVAVCGPRPIDLLALDLALTKLAGVDPSLAELVELRFFGGLSLEEAAVIMEVSPTTIKRGWRTARAFLRLEMKGDASDPGTVGADQADI